MWRNIIRLAPLAIGAFQWWRRRKAKQERPGPQQQPGPQQPGPQATTQGQVGDRLP